MLAEPTTPAQPTVDSTMQAALDAGQGLNRLPKDKS